jgi:hypothetical protein
MTHAYADRELSICFPSEPSERRVNEGPFARALIVHTMAEGARFELARFDLPASLPREKRRILLARVEKGLRARPDVEDVEAGIIAHEGVVTRVLSARLTGQRTGIWWLSFPSPRQMLQVSMIGPASCRDAALRFLETLGDDRCSEATP